MTRSITVLALFCVLAAERAVAEYNANISGQLEGVYVYDYADYVYFRLKNQPTAHPGCDPTYFVIPESVPADRRKAMLARLYLSYSMQDSVNIGYDAVGQCANGYLRVHRVG